MYVILYQVETGEWFIWDIYYTDADAEKGRLEALEKWVVVNRFDNVDV